MRWRWASQYGRRCRKKRCRSAGENPCQSRFAYGRRESTTARPPVSAGCFLPLDLLADSRKQSAQRTESFAFPGDARVRLVGSMNPGPESTPGNGMDHSLEPALVQGDGDVNCRQARTDQKHRSIAVQRHRARLPHTTEVVRARPKFRIRHCVLTGGPVSGRQHRCVGSVMSGLAAKPKVRASTQPMTAPKK
jgi:hypothetical protein